MLLELDEHECRLLSELLDRAHGEQLHGLHHTDTASYKEFLRKRIALIEAVQAKVEKAVCLVPQR